MSIAHMYYKEHGIFPYFNIEKALKTAVSGKFVNSRGQFSFSLRTILYGTSHRP